MEGIITDDSHSSSGIYELNKKRTLITSGLCHITNLKRLRKGQRVHVSNAHIFPSHNAVAMCGRSLLKIKDTDFDSVHCKEDVKTFGKDGLVDLVLQYNIGLESIFFFRQVMAELDREPGDPLPLKYFVDLGTRLGFIDPHPPHRHLIHEFCAPDDPCWLSLKKSSKMSSFRSLKVFLDQFTETLNVNHIQQEKERRNKGDLKHGHICKRFEDSFLVGRLSANPETGYLELSDRTAKVITVPCDSEALPQMLNKLVCVTRFDLILESLKHQGQTRTSCYLRIHEKNMVVLSQPQTSRPKNDLSAYTVLSCSSVFRSKTDLQASVIMVLKQKKKDAVFAKVPLKHLNGSNAVPVGANVMVNPEERCIHFLPILGSLKRFSIRTSPSLSLSTDLVISDDPLAFHADVGTYRLSELEDIPLGEMVTVEGTITEKWFEEKLNSSSINFELKQESADLHIPQDVHIQLKLCESKTEPFEVSCYLCNWNNRAYPLGLLPNSRVRIENVEKIISQKGFIYFTSTLMTKIHILDHIEDKSVDIMPSLSNQHNYLAQISSTKAGQKNISSYKCIFTLENVIKISLSSSCPKCHSRMLKSGCSYVGCHSSESSPAISCKATLHVEDASGSAHLFVQDPDHLKAILEISERDWESLVQEEILGSGELLYLSSSRRKRSSGSSVENAFQIYCETLCQTKYIVFGCECRPFKKDLMRDSDLDLKLFAISIDKNISVH